PPPGPPAGSDGSPGPGWPGGSQGGGALVTAFLSSALARIVTRPTGPVNGVRDVCGKACYSTVGRRRDILGRLSVLGRGRYCVKGRVLVVDDDPSLGEMLGIVLRQEGFEPGFVRSGDQAIAPFHPAKPALGLSALATRPSPPSIRPSPTWCCSTSCCPARTGWRSAASCAWSRACPS